MIEKTIFNSTSQWKRLLSPNNFNVPLSIQKAEPQAENAKEKKPFSLGRALHGRTLVIDVMSSER